MLHGSVETPVPESTCGVPSQSYSVGIDREYYVRRSFRVIAMRVCCVRRVDWLRCIEYSFVYINEREACRPGVAYSDIQRLSGCTTARDVPLATLDVVWGDGIDQSLTHYADPYYLSRNASGCLGRA